MTKVIKEINDKAETANAKAYAWAVITYPKIARSNRVLRDNYQCL